MSVPGNTLAVRVDTFDPDQICRDELCVCDGLHLVTSGRCVRRRSEAEFKTRSKRYAAAPWRAAYAPALRESVRRAIVPREARTFPMILSHVLNDYGSCVDRSVHRHLSALRAEGEIVRLDFPGRMHAYLEAGSRLLSDPELVYEQILDTYSLGSSSTVDIA